LTPLFAAVEMKREPFVGTYNRTFVGASGQVKETLVLKQNMTSYPGSNRKPIVMNGTWRKDGTRAKVSLKTGGQADNITFKLQANQLIATEYDHSIWGADLKYKRVR
jgi:hypothetical protein